MTDEQFTPLAERYMDTVFRVAYSYLRCRDDADDVTQDVLIQLYKQEKAFESDAHVKNWLIRVTVNRCKNVLRAPWHKAEDIADYENSLTFEAPECRELFDAVMSLIEHPDLRKIDIAKKRGNQKLVVGLLEDWYRSRRREVPGETQLSGYAKQILETIAKNRYELSFNALIKRMGELLKDFVEC